MNHLFSSLATCQSWQNAKYASCQNSSQLTPPRPAACEVFIAICSWRTCAYRDLWDSLLHFSRARRGSALHHACMRMAACQRRAGLSEHVATLYAMVNCYLFSMIQPLMCAYTWAPLTMALRLALALPLMSTLTMGSSSYSSGRQLFGLAEHGKLVSKGASACTVHSPCALCEGDCDTDAECARGPSASPA